MRKRNKREGTKKSPADRTTKQSPPRTTEESAASLAELRALRQEFDDTLNEWKPIRQAWESEHHGVSGLVRRWTPIVAIVAGLFAVPQGAKALYDLWRDYREAQRVGPNTRLLPNAEPILELAYDPNGRLLTLSIEFALQNEGRTEDMITATGARLEAPRLTESYIPFDIDAISCHSNGQPLPRQFQIPSAGYRYVRCSLHAILGEISEGTLRGADGVRRLCAKFKTRSDSDIGGRTLAVSACFFMPKALAESILNSRTDQVRRFRQARCDPALMCQ